MKEYNVYFDLETYKEGLQDKYPTGGVYGVVCSWQEGRYYDSRKPLETEVFIGVKALQDFLDYLEATFDGVETKVKLYAYNIPYDFCFMRHELINYWDIKEMQVNLSDNKKILLNGYFTYKNIRFELMDLGLFQRTYSLASWITEIKEKYYKNKDMIVKYRMHGIDKELNITKKLKIEYDKWDLWEDPREFYEEAPHIRKIYYKTALGEEKLLDVTQELDYILIDGLAMPLIAKEIYSIKRDFIKIVHERFRNAGKTEAEIDQMLKDYGFYYKQSVSSVSKCLAEIFIQNKFSDIYRFDLKNGLKECSIASQEYKIQTNSLLGGLTVGNLDFPKYTAKKGETIESYDVNSMYPYVMHNGMPADELRDYTLEGEELWYKDGEIGGDYVAWVFIKGTENDEEPMLEWRKTFKWNGKKIKCPNFDNGILGKTFLEGKKVEYGFYVLRNYWDLLNVCCEHNLKVEKIRYQYLNKDVAGYIEGLSDIKMNSPKGTARNTTAKLAMNSLYGKTLEGSHVYGYTYGIDQLHFKSKKKKILEGVKGHDYDRVGIDGILPTVKEEPDLPCRLAGVYVTNTARVMLLSCIFDEVANGNEFLYADTDSIKLIVRNPVKLHIDRVQLGKWKKEGATLNNPETGKPYYMEFNQWRYPLKVKRYALWNDKHPIEAGHFKFAGIPVKIRNGFKKDPYRVETLFDAEKNILFIDGRTATLRNPTTDQPIILNVDLMTNNKIAPTHMSVYDLENDQWNFCYYSFKELEKHGRELKKKGNSYETDILQGWFEKTELEVLSDDWA